MRYVGTPKEVARQVANHVSNVLGEVGYEQAKRPSDKEMKARVEKLKAIGVKDVGGRLADDLFNEAGVLTDLLGDELYGLENRSEVLDELEKSHRHTAWRLAIAELRKD